MYRFTLTSKLKLKKCPILKSRSKKKPSLLSCAMYLDTETSHNHDLTNPKGWLESICYEFNNEVVILRKPSQFIDCLKQIKSHYNLSDSLKMICYIHNASYDLEYLMPWLIQAFGTDYKMLAVGNHKIITFEIDSFIFKCSYKLSNKSLAKWCKDLDTEHKKMEGAVDYEKVNYQDTILSKSELKYQYIDVLTLKDCVIKQMEIYNDTLLSIPLTSTSYIRRSMRNRYKLDLMKNRYQFLRSRLDKRMYVVNVGAFSGGYTHGNRFLKNKTLVVDKSKYDCILHRDFISHYPSQLRVNDYPMSKWFLLANWKDKPKIKDVFRYEEDYCLMMDIRIEDLTIKKGVTMPFAQFSKFFIGRIGSPRFVTDNGRLLKMEGGTIVSITSMDLHILSEQYTFSYEIVNLYASKKGMLPAWMIQTVDEFFNGKTHYKEILHDLKKQGFSDYSNEFVNANVDLMKSKNGLNGIYGCCASRPCRDDITMSEDGKWKVELVNEQTITDKLDKYYNSFNNMLSYSWGVYCTSYARYELYEFIKCIGYDNAIYCDTDSIFYYSNDEIEKKIDILNNKKRKNAIERNAFIETEKGTILYYDWFDLEDERIEQFRFLHSKCYCYVEDNGQEHLTIAGVSQFNNDKTINRMQELGSIDNLNIGFVFKECGGTLSTHVNYAPHIEYIDGHQLEIASACIITRNTKTLKDQAEELDIDYIETYEEGMEGDEII